MRIVVPVGLGPKQQTAPLEKLDNGGVRLLEELARHRFHLRQEVSVEPDPVDHRQPVGLPQREVVFAVGGRAMHDASPVFDGDELAGAHPADVALGGQVVEQSLIGEADQVCPLDDPLGRVGRVAHHRFDQGLGEDQGFVPAAHVCVVHLGMYREREIGRKGPRGRRPYHERGAIVAGGGEPEANEDGRVLDLLIAEGHLVRGKGGSDAWVVGHDLVALIDEPLVPDLLEQPPHRFDVVVVEGVVGVLHAHPETHALGHRFPIADVAQDRVSAPASELRHPDLSFNAGLVVDP